jgi:hydrogenase expression/formation protein HypE
VANEGKLIVIAPPQEAEAALAAMRASPYGRGAARVGVVRADDPGRVLVRTLIGGTRIMDMLAGEMLPRIC